MNASLLDPAAAMRERRLAELLAAAEDFSVKADGHEANANIVEMRAAARTAARHYAAIAWTLYRSEHERAGRAWASAAREYRRGLSHARAGQCSMHADWMRDVASGKTRIVDVEMAEEKLEPEKLEREELEPEEVERGGS